MNPSGAIAKRAAIWLIIGLLGGGIVADQWSRHQAARDLEAVTVRHADELHDARARIEQLRKDLDVERQRRESLEGVLADLRKGS